MHKCLGYFEIENIDNTCIMTNTYNPKEYFELFETAKKKKKHKEIKDGLSGMNFKNYASRIIFQTNFDIFEKPPARCIEVNCSPGRDEKENIGKNKIFSI